MSEPIRYDVLHEYSQRNQLDYNDLCRVVRDACSVAQPDCVPRTAPEAAMERRHTVAQLQLLAAIVAAPEGYNSEFGYPATFAALSRQGLVERMQNGSRYVATEAGRALIAGAANVAAQVPLSVEAAARLGIVGGIPQGVAPTAGVALPDPLADAPEVCEGCGAIEAHGEAHHHTCPRGVKEGGDA